MPSNTSAFDPTASPLIDGQDVDALAAAVWAICQTWDTAPPQPLPSWNEMALRVVFNTTPQAIVDHAQSSTPKPTRGSDEPNWIWRTEQEDQPSAQDKWDAAARRGVDEMDAPDLVLAHVVLRALSHDPTHPALDWACAAIRAHDQHAYKTAITTIAVSPNLTADQAHHVLSSPRLLEPKDGHEWIEVVKVCAKREDVDLLGRLWLYPTNTGLRQTVIRAIEPWAALAVTRSPRWLQTLLDKTTVSSAESDPSLITPALVVRTCAKALLRDDLPTAAARLRICGSHLAKKSLELHAWTSGAEEVGGWNSPHAMKAFLDVPDDTHPDWSQTAASAVVMNRDIPLQSVDVCIEHMNQDVLVDVLPKLLLAGLGDRADIVASRISDEEACAQAAAAIWLAWDKKIPHIGMLLKKQLLHDAVTVPTASAPKRKL